MIREKHPHGPKQADTRDGNKQRSQRRGGCKLWAEIELLVCVWANESFCILAIILAETRLIHLLLKVK